MTCPFRGGFFTASPGDPDLLALAAAGNSAAASVLPSDAAAFLVARPAEGTGLGLYLRDQFTCPHEMTLAAYWGHLTRTPNPSSHFVYQYPPGSVPGVGLHLCVDAHNQCRHDPPLVTHAGFANHSCENPTCAPHLLRIPGCPLPVIVLRPRHSLRGGSAITYNYDAHSAADAFTVTAGTAATLLAAGRACFPCRCADPLPCPRHRYFL